jgi:amino acid adenylation domain-containing protein
LDVRLSADGERLRLNAPKGVLTASLRTQIAERKQELLEFLRNQKQSAALVPPPIKPRGSTDPAPLSFAQERLWFLEQLEPEAAVYNICRASRVLGNLNASALEATLKEIVGRHEVLRTAFRLIDGKPVQIVQPSTGVSIKTVDLSSLSEDTRQTEIVLTIKSETERPFDLSTGQLLRCTVIRARNDEDVLILTTHHSVSDVWSMGILTRELWILYDAFSNKKPSPFKPVSVKYSDYALWQRNWLQGDVLESQIDYWKERLKDLPVLNFPTDRPRKPHQSFCGARLPMVLPEDLTRSVNELSVRFAVTPFMTLLAAFQVLLYRYTGQEDVVVGSPIANRRRPELEELIGFFVNTLVLRADLSENPSFSDFLLRVRDTCVGADRNQDLPFEKLVQELQPQRDQSRNPLFQVMFVLQNATSPFTGIPGLRIEPLEAGTTRSPFDVSLFLREREGKYIGDIEYSTDLFDRDRIERMAGHFQTLLEAIISDPDQSIATLPILTESERHQILVEWNDTAIDYPKDKCIHHLFEEQVERTPEAIALQFEDQHITYRELNQRANQLAHYLTTLGIGPEKLVGICVERSIEMVVALLGILKAGGAYVPLDPAYPKERLRFMVEDSKVSVLLTEERLLGHERWKIEHGDSPYFIPNPRLGLVCLDRDWPLIAQEQADNPKQAVTSKNLAYIIYTSGSIGHPKGVLATHAGAVNRFAWMWNQYPFLPNEKCCIKTSLSFVDSVWELFGPLLKGVVTTLVPEDIVKDLPRFVQVLAHQRITRIVLVPSLLQSILHTLELHSVLPNLTLWSSSGEALSRELVDEFRRSLPGRTLLNLYGSSELAADVTCLNCSDQDWGTKIGIGRPICNTQIYILDSRLQPLPIGVPGEICVGGAGLARGYLNLPELTNEKFIRNPFKGDENLRLYKTGDLACYKPDGIIEYLGRSDNQVNVNGYRIEPGEIEFALMQNDEIQNCLVTVQRNESLGRNELVGYLVLKKASHIFTSTAARQFLAPKLPQYMIPSHFVVLNTLPLTPNGKLDRKALPPLNQDFRDRAHGIAEPRTEIEHLVAQVLRETLKLDRIGVDDNFFELGGHSLLVTQAVRRLNDVCNRMIPFRALFDHPTVATLAHYLRTTNLHACFRRLPSIVPVQQRRQFPLSLSQQHLWAIDKLVPETPFFNMPYAYRLRGPLDIRLLRKSLRRLMLRHQALRTRFVEIDSVPHQIIVARPRLDLKIFDLRAMSAEALDFQVQHLMRKEANIPFDLAKGPPFRARLYSLRDEHTVMLVVMHHIISDRWSLSVFFDELVSCYQAFYERRHLRLPNPPIQLVDFAVWEEQLLENGLLNSQIQYWKETLSGSLSQTNNNDQLNNISFNTERKTFVFDDKSFADLKEFASKENCTMFMILHAALATLLYQHTGDSDIRIGTLVANRNQPEMENVIGHFVNTIILRTEIYPHLTFRELLRQLRETVLQACSNQELPFEKLVQTLEAECTIDRTQLFPALLNYHAYNSETRNVCGLSFAPLGWQSPSYLEDLMFTTFDLVANFRETSTTLTASVTIKTRIFGQRSIDRVIQRLERIVNAMIDKPEQMVCEMR